MFIDHISIMFYDMPYVNNNIAHLFVLQYGTDITVRVLHEYEFKGKDSQ